MPLGIWVVTTRSSAAYERTKEYDTIGLTCGTVILLPPTFCTLYVRR